VGELLSPETVNGEPQEVGLVLLAGANVCVSGGVGGGGADAAPRPFIQVKARIPPPSVVVRYWPAAIELTPHR